MKIPSGKSGPLKGIRVLDLTSALMGPYCTQVLADLGADVIKVESKEGDTTRWLPPGRYPDRGGLFMTVNRGKRSIVLDLKSDKGRAALLRLVQQSDVLVHSLRFKAIQKLKLDYDSVREAAPKLIYLNLYGFGRTGPYKDLPAYDDVIQAAAGLATLQGQMEGGAPQYMASTVADQVTGLTGVYAITAALFERTKSGLGQEIEIGMFETMTSFIMAQHMCGAIYEPPLGPPVYPRVISRFRKPYKTKDGYIAVMIYKDKHWKQFFEVIGNPPWTRSEKFSHISRRTENINELYQTLEETFVSRTTEEWIEALHKGQIPAMRLASTEDLLTDPHLEAVNFWKASDTPDGPVKLPGIPTAFSRTPGSIGELDQGLGFHTKSVLAEAGFTEDEINDLTNVTQKEMGVSA